MYAYICIYKYAYLYIYMCTFQKLQTTYMHICNLQFFSINPGDMAHTKQKKRSFYFFNDS